MNLGAVNQSVKAVGANDKIRQTTANNLAKLEHPLATQLGNIEKGAMSAFKTQEKALGK